MATEQEIYEMLARIDHPVFPRDMSDTTDADSPFNSIMNRLRAKQLVKLNTAIASLALNAYPNTCDENTIDRWEQTYFGFVKASGTIEERRVALLIKIATRLTMSATDVLALALAITGQTPTLTRNLWFGRWLIGTARIGVDNYVQTGDADGHSATYLLRFAASVDSALRIQLDKALTQIEKGGSRHAIVTPDD